MKQRWLPEFDYPDVDAPESGLDTAGIADKESAATFAEVLPGQLGLLTAERELVGQIEAALAARKRMKQFDAGMHALFMRDGVRRE